MAGSAVLLTYSLWSLFIVPPFSSGRAFLEFAALQPGMAFLDDWLLLSWFILVLGLLLSVHRRLAQLAPDEALLLSVVGTLGVLVAIMRSVFNLGRLQVLAAHFATAPENERQVLVSLLGWTEQGDVARNLALVLVGGWMTWSASLGVRVGALPRWLGRFGQVAGLSVILALIGYLIGAAPLTQPDRYLSVVFSLWIAWTGAMGLMLFRGR